MQYLLSVGKKKRNTDRRRTDNAFSSIDFCDCNWDIQCLFYQIRGVSRKKPIDKTKKEPCAKGRSLSIYKKRNMKNFFCFCFSWYLLERYIHSSDLVSVGFIFSTWYFYFTVAMCDLETTPPSLVPQHQAPWVSESGSRYPISIPHIDHNQE